MEEELLRLNFLVNKKELTYNEFNELIGNYYIYDYEEFEDGCYLIDIKSHGTSYTDYIYVKNV